MVFNACAQSAKSKTHDEMIRSHNRRAFMYCNYKELTSPHLSPVVSQCSPSLPFLIFLSVSLSFYLSISLCLFSLSSYFSLFSFFHYLFLFYLVSIDPHLSYTSPLSLPPYIYIYSPFFVSPSPPVDINEEI